MKKEVDAAGVWKGIQYVRGLSRNRKDGCKKDIKTDTSKKKDLMIKTEEEKMI